MIKSDLNWAQAYIFIMNRRYGPPEEASAFGRGFFCPSAYMLLCHIIKHLILFHDRFKATTTILLGGKNVLEYTK